MTSPQSSAVQNMIEIRKHWLRQQAPASWEKIRLAVRHQIESRKADRLARVYLAHENWSSEAYERVRALDKQRVQSGKYRTAKAPSNYTWFAGFNDLLVRALRSPITQWKNRLDRIKTNSFYSLKGSCLYTETDEAVDKHFFDLAVAREHAFRKQYMK